MDKFLELTGIFSPNLFIGVIASALMASLFHLWKNGGPGKLIIYLIFAFLGYLLFSALFALTEVDVFKIGPYDPGAGVIGSIVLLFFSHWLTKTKKNR